MEYYVNSFEDYINRKSKTEVLHGRQPIYTDVLPLHMQSSMYDGLTLDKDTFPDVISKAIEIHQWNTRDIKYLKSYYLGIQEIYIRDDLNRKVNNKIVIDYANAFTRDIVGYTYGKPIQYVQREQKYKEDVEKINNFVNSESKFALDKMMADDQSICGTAYRAVLPDNLQYDDNQMDECPFELVYLNPETTFVCYSAYNINKPVFSCTYTDVKNDKDSYRIYQVYTSKKLYKYKHDIYNNTFKNVLEIDHYLNNVPIVEYMNNQFRLGDWEMVIPLMDAINNTVSDSVNDIEQTIMSYLALFGVDLMEEDFNRMREDRILIFPGIQGINQDAKFITMQLDGQSVQLLRSYLEEALKAVVGIPDRKTRGGGGGDTGDAVKLRDGWEDIEIVARNKELFTTMSEQRTLSIILNILKPDYIKNDIGVKNIDIKFSRNKTNNLQSKVQSGSILHSMNIPEEYIAEVMDLTNDNIGMVNAWKDSIEKKTLELNMNSKINTELEKETKTDPRPE